MKAQTTKNSKNSVLSRNNIASALKANALGKDSEGVSAVIGVILMVAITVIAAAIIGTFVLGIMGNQPSAPGFAAFSAERDIQTGDIIIKNVQPSGLEVSVSKIIDADTGAPLAGTTTDPGLTALKDLSKLMVPYTVDAGASPVVANDEEAVPTEGVTIAIVGKTGGATSENVLQTIYVPAV